MAKTTSATTTSPRGTSAGTARSVWKGAISFGLVHVPVALYPASRDQGVDFDWLDRRSMDPVGYKRVNKRSTGKEITKEDIVRGVKLDDGKYVVLTDAEIGKAYPRTTQTIDIECFVQATDMSFVYLERPYYLAPQERAAKVYALLREAMAESGLIGIARLVMHSKEHLVALLPAGPALMVAMLRWASEIRSPDALDLPPEGASANNLKDAELAMARQLIGDMTRQWDPTDYEDEFAKAIHELVARRAKAGQTENVTALEDVPDERASNVVDLTELLRKSLQRKPGAKASGKAPAKSGPAKKQA